MFPRNPDEVFTINAITRRGVMEDIQDIRTACGYKHPTGPQEIAEDDDRLTDDICQEYANAFSDIDDFSEDVMDELSHNAACTALEAMGYVCEDDDDWDERQVLLDEIRCAENELIVKRARLQQLDAVTWSDKTKQTIRDDFLTWSNYAAPENESQIDKYISETNPLYKDLVKQVLMDFCNGMRRLGSQHD